MLLEHDEFLKQLEGLCAEAKGSVFLTLKRYDYEGDSAGDTDMAGPAASSSAAGAGSTYPYLARVTNGHKLKISTLVQPSDYEAFTSKFTALLKASLTPRMKKKDKKRTQQQQQQQQQGGRGGTGPGSRYKLPQIKGPARGKGHSKRQRSVKSRQRVADRLKAKKLAAQQASARLEILKRNIQASTTAGAPEGQAQA